MTALLRAHWRHIDWRLYWHRVRKEHTPCSLCSLDAPQSGRNSDMDATALQVLFLCFMATLNTAMGLVDWWVLP